MARKKTPETRVNIKAEISGRLRDVRQELFGDHGGPDLARRLNLPARTWYNYETGVTVPAEILLAFIDQTGANPKWLLTGEGSRFRHESEDTSLDDLTPSDLIRRSLAQLAKEHESLSPNSSIVDFVRITVVPLDRLDDVDAEHVAVGNQVLVDRSWIAHPAETLASTIEDDSMDPILPMGSLIAVDLSPPRGVSLSGRIVASRSGDRVVVRWYEEAENQIILRSNRPSDFPLIRFDPGRNGADIILGQVVWSWSSFSKD